jgi:UDPglucose 6-dehydrogenase
LFNLYKPILEQTFAAPSFLPRPEDLSVVPLVTTDLASSELIKYAANSFLAMKISFINEIGQLAERVGGDIQKIAKGIGLDSRIGTRFLQAGIGWGGSCFGKDTAALISSAAEYGLTMPLVTAAREVNYRQREYVLKRLLDELRILKGKTIGLLGLAFKPYTDDLRDSPAIDIARLLLDRGAWVRAHDPVALDHARQEYPDLGISFVEEVESLALDADALVLVTEWPVYRDLPWETIAQLMRGKLVLDGRNVLDRVRLQSAGIHYVGLGAISSSTSDASALAFAGRSQMENEKSTV